MAFGSLHRHSSVILFTQHTIGEKIEDVGEKNGQTNFQKVSPTSDITNMDVNRYPYNIFEAKMNDLKLSGFIIYPAFTGSVNLQPPKEILK